MQDSRQTRELSPGQNGYPRARTLASHAPTDLEAGALTTDIHLAALAIAHGATLISYDNDFARFEHLHWERPES